MNYVLPKPDDFHNYFFNTNHLLGPIIWHSGCENGKYYLSNQNNDIIMDKSSPKYFNSPTEALDFLNAQTPQV